MHDRNQAADEVFRNRITVYGMFLTVLVVYVHAAQGRGILETVLSDFAGQAAVPGFFLMSGYLFFRKTGSLAGPAFFVSSWKRRLRSLLTPYLLWNGIYYLIYLLAGRDVLTIGALFEGIFLYSRNPVFWYLRQLMILSILAFPLYYLLRRKNSGLITLAAIFAAAVFYEGLPFHVANEDALFYFALGAWFALHLRTRLEDERFCLDGYEPLWLLAICLVSLWYLRGIDITSIAAVIIYRASLACFFFTMVCLIVVHGFEPRPYMKNTFLVYATHYLVIRAVFIAAPERFLTPLYLLMPCICFAAVSIMRAMLIRFFPKVLALLSGGR